MVHAVVRDWRTAGLSETDLSSYDRLATVHRRVLRRLSPREVIELLRDALRSNAVADPNRVQRRKAAEPSTAHCLMI